MNKIFSAFGALIIIYMAVLYAFFNYNVGLVVGFGLGIGFLIIPMLPPTFVVKIIRVLFGIVVLFFVAMAAFIAVNSTTNSADYSEDAVIVLGCGIRGTSLTSNLKDRLDCAIEYANQNEKAIIVVTGGQGPQEDIPEAVAMKNYLVENNIDSGRIVEEAKATSTNENFSYSKEILDDMLGSDYKVAYITNDFHIYRAGKLAEKYELNARGFAAKTNIHSIVPNYLRESLAIIQLWVFGI